MATAKKEKKKKMKNKERKKKTVPGGFSKVEKEHKDGAHQ